MQPLNLDILGHTRNKVHVKNYDQSRITQSHRKYTTTSLNIIIVLLV